MKAEFAPEDYRAVLSRLARMTGTSLQFAEEGGELVGGQVDFPIRQSNKRIGWVVRGHGVDQTTRQTAEAAAEVISHLFTVDQDITSLSGELAYRYEELNFLYEVVDRVGAMIDEDEICRFVVEEATWLLNCERASVMVVSEDSGELTIRASVGLPEEIADKVVVRPGERISGKVFETGRAMVVNEGEPMPGDSLRTDELAESNCFLSVLLKISGESSRGETILGVINLTRKRGGGIFTASDLKLVSAVAATTATQIHDCRLRKVEREHQRLEQEVQLAARIQLGLLPEGPLRVGPLMAGGRCLPARHVGGDLFDYWVQDEHVCLIVADVSGHDIGAALMAAALRSVVRSEAAHRSSVAGLMERVNKVLFDDLIRSELFISAFYAEIDVGARRMDFCRAGHPLPLLIQGDRRKWLDTEGMLLGLVEGGRYEQESIQLEVGDTVVFYTDGLIEAMDGRNVLFGTGGLQEATLQAFQSPPAQMAESIVGAAISYSGGHPVTDDITVMVARLAPEESG
ncbi:MAG: SpoIIE family protein phosphatase [Planctomycetes bacterium]|nr:SpoIIE family protein phosphatase [Planctomycetota bacterium]